MKAKTANPKTRQVTMQSHRPAHGADPAQTFWAETQKRRTAKVAESPEGKSPLDLHGVPWRRKSTSSNAESQAEDERVRSRAYPLGR